MFVGTAPSISLQCQLGAMAADNRVMTVGEKAQLHVVSFANK